MSNTFGSVIDQLVQEIEGLRASIGPLMQSADFNAKFNDFLFYRFLEDNAEPLDANGDGSKSYRVGPGQFSQLRRLERGRASASVAVSLLPSSLLVTLVSRFDAYLGRLIRVMVLTRPELLKTSERTLTLSTLIDLADFDSARDYLVEKEIESVLRKSHSDHFDWLESRLGMELRKDLPSWKTFIELTERRNLFVHCDGIVSHQYLGNCKEHGVPNVACRVGDKLDAPPKYYREACDCIIEIAVKLTHVVWRKLLPTDRELADEALNQTGFELIVHGNYALAYELMRFACDVPKKHASERHRLMLLVNWAQSCKWLNRNEECIAMLSKEDWSAKGLDFQICVAVLRDDFVKTVELMKEIGKDGSVKADAYRDWPIFRLARKEEIFLAGYKETFGEEMQIGERNVVPLQQSQLEDFLKTIAGEGSVSAITEQAPPAIETSPATHSEDSRDGAEKG